MKLSHVFLCLWTGREQKDVFHISEYVYVQHGVSYTQFIFHCVTRQQAEMFRTQILTHSVEPPPEAEQSERSSLS